MHAASPLGKDRSFRGDALNFCGDEISRPAASPCNINGPVGNTASPPNGRDEPPHISNADEPLRGNASLFLSDKFFSGALNSCGSRGDEISSASASFFCDDEFEIIDVLFFGADTSCGTDVSASCCDEPSSASPFCKDGSLCKEILDDVVSTGGCTLSEHEDFSKLSAPSSKAVKLSVEFA